MNAMNDDSAAMWGSSLLPDTNLTTPPVGGATGVHMTTPNTSTTATNATLSLEEIYLHFIPYIVHIDRYLTPVWYIIGMPSNLLAFIMWVQPRMRPSSGCYLAALAMCDFVFLVLQLIFELQNMWEVPLLVLPVLCETFPVLFLTSQYLSPILVLAFTVERYISICHPFRRERFCTTQRAIKVIISLVFLCLALHAVQAYFWQYSDNDCSLRNEVIADGSRSVWSIWSWVTELMVFAVVPIAILLLNIMVIKETRRLSRTEETRLCMRKGHKSSAATVTLLAVSFYLIFTTLPVTCCYALYLNFQEGSTSLSLEEIATDDQWQRHFSYHSVRRIIEEIGMSHYACNFFIYILTGKLFRLEMRLLSYRLFCKDKLRKWRSDQYSGLDQRSSLVPQTTLGTIAPAESVKTNGTATESNKLLTQNHGNGNGVAL